VDTLDRSDLDASEQPFEPAPDADDPRRGREVFAPIDGAFEAPAKDLVPGPYYLSVDEVMPEVGERPEAPADLKEKAKKFPLDRRDFMKMFSTSALTASAAGCLRRPLEKAVPHVNQPIDTTYGEPTYYATTCGECSSGCGVMVKTREGRPVKVEGLPNHPVSNGKLCSVGQSTLQGLYHPERRKAPMVRFGESYEQLSWEDVYEHLGGRLAKTQKIGILTSGATGHAGELYREWLERMGSSASRLYTYDSNSLAEAITAAHQIAFGIAAMPRVSFRDAKLVFGIGSDFLDVGTSVVFNTKTYSDAHAFQGDAKGRHVQLEATMTLTGARCDERFVIAPGSEALATLLLVRSLMEKPNAKGSGAARGQIQQVLEQKAELLNGGYDRVGVQRTQFDKWAEELLAQPSVVLCGGSHFDENATNLQLAAIMANELIGAYDQTLHLSKSWMVPPVKPGDLQRFVAEAGDLDVLFVIGVDPAFTLPASWGVVDLLKKIPTLVSVQPYPTETCQLAAYQLNSHHWLEAWGDEQPIAGFWSARQPSVRPTTDSRQTEDILLWLAAVAKKPMGHRDYRDYLRKKWLAVYQTVGAQTPDFDAFFDAVLHQGFAGKIATQAVSGITSDLAANFKYVDAARSGLRLVAPLDFRLRDGKFAHRPILQETADTLTTITWDTWVGLNPTTASKLGLRQYDVVKVEGPAGSFEASVYPLPGLHPDAVVVPRGNGHSATSGTIERLNGINPLVAFAKASDALTGAPVTSGQPVKLTRTGAVFQMAALQKHNDLANRKDIYKTVALKTAVVNRDKKRDLDDVPDLYPELPKKDYRWGMSIDLGRCTGCGACHVACSTENNVPQIGREQVLLGREMHWIKIDRYWKGSTDNPQVALQPMLCQHCKHAPCEAVCPVYATTHDNEGVNSMTYNRCIGTRYCANACPYKIRRFNWWTHKWGVMGERKQDRIPRAMNPDVTVRTRGVMEKCSFCYQRVRDAKHRVKLRGTPLVDGELKTACQQTCPADAITFGNLFDPAAAATRLRQDFRAYMALNGNPDLKEYGIKTVPSVSYLANVTFAEEPADEHHGGKKEDHHG
jgi:molybdopterin-containing oxidoreductase family iron-sulfur binding subunit